MSSTNRNRVLFQCTLIHTPNGYALKVGGQRPVHIQEVLGEDLLEMKRLVLCEAKRVAEAGLAALEGADLRLEQAFTEMASTPTAVNE